MASGHPVSRLREVENGLGLLAAEVEEQLDTKPINLLYWQREVRDVITELEEGRWRPAPSPSRPQDNGR